MATNLKTRNNMARKKKINYTYAVGRRRSAAARVRLFKGKEENLVNDKPIKEYFPGILMKAKWEEPFKLTDTTGKYYVTVKVVGGGKEGQLDAVVHGMARATQNYTFVKLSLNLLPATCVAVVNLKHFSAWVLMMKT